MATAKRSTYMSPKEKTAITFERAVDRTHHNPINNPLDGNESNPYIARQKKLILSQVAHT